MGLFEFILALTIVGTGGSMIANILNHRQKLAEIRIKTMQQGNETLLAELRDLKNQVSQLRDTTTTYDLSFDAALQRLESRMSHVEQRLTRVEQTRGIAPSGRS